MAAIKELFGDLIVGKDGEKVNAESLGGPEKSLGIYFSAHWCPPCRGFTPTLVEFYNRLKTTETGDNMDIIFVSSDRDEQSFNEYYSEMPWLALKYSARDKKDELSKKFKVNGIPMLVILDGNGQVITANGRSLVNEAPEGQGWPWYPKPFAEVLQGKLVTNDKTEKDTTALEGKVKGFYFSAHWCPPCKTFTPILVKTYNKLKEEGKDFEIVFVSSDRDQASFDDYFGSMPWLAVPFGDTRQKSLSSYFEVGGIPMLVILDEENKVITANGRSSVMGDLEGKDFPWYKKPMDELSGSAAEVINESKCLIVFTDGSEAAADTAKEAMSAQADKYYKKLEDQELHFFYTREDEIVEGLCSYMKLERKDPMIIVTDILEGCYYLSDCSDVTSDNIAQFCDDVMSGKAEKKRFR